MRRSSRIYWPKLQRQHLKATQSQSQHYPIEWMHTTNSIDKRHFCHLFKVRWTPTFACSSNSVSYLSLYQHVSVMLTRYSNAFHIQNSLDKQHRSIFTWHSFHLFPSIHSYIRSVRDFIEIYLFVANAVMLCEPQKKDLSLNCVWIGLIETKRFN